MTEPFPAFTDLRPENYELCLDLNLEAFTYACNETITVTVLHPTTTAVMDIRDLVIPKEGVSVEFPDGRVVPAVSVAVDNTAESLTVCFPETLPDGAAVKIHINFVAPISAGLDGLYRSKYTTTDKDGGAPKTKYMVSTQFESTSARKAFPCWDRPAAKATFGITVILDSTMDALSNMPIEREEPLIDSPGRKRVVFGTTPRMTTFLVALVCGEFERVHAKTKHGVEVSVYTMRGKKHLGQLALETGVYVLDYYTDFFDLGYPLPKCDMVAIPDFDAGAMENWGLVTYRESALLFDDAAGSQTMRERVSIVVAHELAHQWFGNLCTMRWWNDLWLNEGFASYMEVVSVDSLHPEWGLWPKFVSESFFSACSLDAKDATHPISVPVTTPAEIASIFDAIVYEKGSSIIRMIASFFGPVVFRDALRSYLAAHVYANAVSADLWAAFSKVVGKDVASLVVPWTESAGFPLVSVSRDPADGSLVLTQRRFHADGRTDEADASKLWWIPLEILTEEDPSKAIAFEMHTKEARVDSVHLKPGQWVKVNAGNTAFCRVHYSSDLLLALTEAVRKNALSPVDRLGVLGDTFALASAGILDNVDLVRLLLAYDHEDNDSVLSLLVSSVTALRNLYSADPKATDVFRALYVRLFRPLADKLGWDNKEGESSLVRKARSSVVGMLVGIGDKGTVQEAISRYISGKYSSDVKKSVYCAVSLYGDKQTLRPRLYDDLRKADLKEKQTELISAISTVTDPEEARQVLEWAAHSGDVRPQDFYFVTSAICRRHRRVVWDWLVASWDWFCNDFGLGDMCFPYTVEDGVSSLRTLDDIKEMDAFFASHPHRNAGPKIAAAREDVLGGIRWREKCDKDGLLEWMEKNI